MKTILKLFSALLISSSCTNSRTIDTLLLVGEDSNILLLELKDKGNDYIADIRSEVSTTKDNQILQNKLSGLFKKMQSIDSISNFAISQIDLIKIQLLQTRIKDGIIKDLKTLPILINYHSIENPSSNSSVNQLLQCKESDKLSPILNKLNTTLTHLPSELLNIMCTYADFHPSFPIIKDYKNIQELEQLLEEKIDSKTYNEKEEREVVWDIYKLLSKNNPNDKIHWLNNYFSNQTTIEAVLKLNRLQAEILRARNLILMNLSAKRNRCGYGSTEIIALINGPSSMKTGEMATIKVGIGAFDETNDPTIELNSQKEVKIIYEEGFAYITFPAENGVQLLSGTVSIKNKSGVEKRLPFEWELLGK